VRTAVEIASQVRTGRRKAVDIVTEALGRADRSQGDLNAFTLIDHEGALARARGIDILVASGRDPGPLAGVPIGLKDLIDQAGLPNTRGGSFPVEPSTHSATVVRRLGTAGAVIIGRTGLHEFAFGFTSENHWFGRGIWRLPPEVRPVDRERRWLRALSPSPSEQIPAVPCEYPRRCVASSASRSLTDAFRWLACIRWFPHLTLWVPWQRT